MQSIFTKEMPNTSNMHMASQILIRRAGAQNIILEFIVRSEWKSSCNLAGCDTAANQVTCVYSTLNYLDMCPLEGRTPAVCDLGLNSLGLLVSDICSD